MKLEDKAIDKIVAMFDAEIEELAKTVEHAGAEAAAEVKSKAEAEIVNEQQPAADGSVAEEDAKADALVIEEEQSIAADEPVADGELPAAADEAVAEEEPPVVSDEAPVEEEQPAAADEPIADEDTEPEAPAADETAAEAEPETVTEQTASEDPASETAPEPEADNYTDGTPAAPSGSPAKNILGAVGYIIAVIAICVLSVVCVNLLDNNVQRMKPAAPPDIPQADLAASLQAYTTNEVFAQKAVPQLTLEEIYALDLRKPSNVTEEDLKRVSKAGLVGLEDTFLEAEKKYGVNAVFLMSIASLESAHGTQMYRPNNMFGYGGKSYPSKEACIMDVAQGLSSRYLSPGASLYGGSPTLSGVNKRYAANPQWDTKVGKYMKSYYDVIAPYHNQTLDKLK